jgi:hypothetical protein
MSDRYAEVVELIEAAIAEHPQKGSEVNHPLRTRLHEIVRTRGRAAALRSRCDRMGHEPETLTPVRLSNMNGELAVFKVACSFCGTELKEVEQ